MDPIDHAKQKLYRYFTEEEVAALSPEEVQFLALVETDDLPSIAEDERGQAEADYRARVCQALRQRRDLD